MANKTHTKTSLAALYGVSYPTFQKWLLDIPDLEIKPNTRVLTPKQVAKIMKELDPP